MTQTPEGSYSPPPYGAPPTYPGQAPFGPNQAAAKPHGAGRVVAIVAGVIVLLFVVGLIGLVALGAAVSDDQEASDESAPGATSRPSSAALTSAGLADGQQVRSIPLRKGDCVRSKIKGEVSDLDVVSCTESHDGEVTGVYRATGGSYPGENAITAEAERRCADLAPDNLASTTRDDLSIYFIYPRRANWAVGDREVQCLVVGKKSLTARLAAL